MKFSQTPIEYRQAPPVLGEHNTKIFGELLGLSDQEQQVLAAEGII